MIKRGDEYKRKGTPDVYVIREALHDRDEYLLQHMGLRVFWITGFDLALYYEEVPLPNLIKNYIEGLTKDVSDYNRCTHEWKEYLGFRETYKDCVKCGAKG